MVKPEHAVAVDGKKMYIQEIMTPAPSINALNNSAFFSFIVENDAAGLIKDVVLRFSVTLKSVADGGSGVNQKLMPVPLWFDRIEWFDRHTGREIARYHGDGMWFLLQTLPPATLEYLADPVNFDCKSGKESSCQLTVEETKNYYLPLPYTWLDDFELDLSLLRGDLEIKLYPKGDIRVDPTVGARTDFALNEIRWIGASEMFSQVSRLQFRKMKALSTLQHNYLDLQQYTDSGRVINAGSDYTIDLDQFHHESAYLWFTIRRDDQNVNALRYVSLGPRGTIDHENVHGRSLLGDGTPIDEKYCRKFLNTKLWPHGWVNYNPVYLIPFSNDEKGTLRGEIDGWHEFRGDRERLRIVTAAAPTDTFYTTTFSANIAATAFATFEYKGDYSATFNTGTATYDDLTAAANAIGTVIKEGIEFKIRRSSLLDAGTDPLDLAGTMLFYVYERGSYNSVTSQGQPYLLNGVGDARLILNDNTALVNNVLGGSVQGVQGFVAGTYQIDVYSVYYRHIQQHNGRLEMEDL